MFLNELVQFGEDVLSSCANSNNFLDSSLQLMIEKCFCFLIGNPTKHNQLHLV